MVIVRNYLQMLEVINSKELVNNRKPWRGVVVATKSLNGIY